MSDSILLALSGSQESLYAAELARLIATETGALVQAQHVVNSRGALALVSLEKAGLIGSGPYLAAYETTTASLREIADKLSEAYSARFCEDPSTAPMVIDDGDPQEEICRRAREHDLIVAGHRQRAFFEPPSGPGIRLSLAEMLSQESTVPLLIVQSPVKKFAHFELFISMDHFNAEWVQNCLVSAKGFGVTCALTVLAAGLHEEEPMDFVRNLKSAHPQISQLRIKIVTKNGNRAAQIASHHFRTDLGTEGSILAVIPTIDSGEMRLAAGGELPSILLRRLAFDSVLFWPEEHNRPIFDFEGQAVSNVHQIRSKAK